MARVAVVGVVVEQGAAPRPARLLARVGAVGVGEEAAAGGVAQPEARHQGAVVDEPCMILWHAACLGAVK